MAEGTQDAYFSRTLPLSAYSLVRLSYFPVTRVLQLRE